MDPILTPGTSTIAHSNQLYTATVTRASVYKQCNTKDKHKLSHLYDQSPEWKQAFAVLNVRLKNLHLINLSNTSVVCLRLSQASTSDDTQ